MNLFFTFLFIAMLIRLVWYEVMVRVLTRWIQYLDRIPTDAQINYLTVQEIKRMLHLPK